MNLADYAEQPYEISVETLALCNAACGFCPYETMDRKGVAMQDTLISRLIAEMSTFKKPFVFSPFKVNEPLLDTRLRSILYSFIDRTPEHGKIRLFTNGTPLTLPVVKWIGELPPARVEHLWVSLNSMDAMDHQREMRFAQPMFEKIARNLDRIHEQVREGQFAHRVVVSRVAAANVHDMGFMKRAGARWPRFTVHLIKRDAWLQDIAAPQVPIPNASCVRWWELSITATGLASLCCMDAAGKFKRGDVNVQSLLEIYNSHPWPARRQAQETRKNVFPCSTCSY